MQKGVWNFKERLERGWAMKGADLLGTIITAVGVTFLLSIGAHFVHKVGKKDLGELFRNIFKKRKSDNSKE